MEPQGPVEGGSSSGPETAAEGAQEQTAPPDAGNLVNRMIAAGEWPEPALVEQILAAGEAAVEPLREVLQTRPMGWPAEAPLVHAVGLLSMLRPPSALPDLIAVARFYKSETGDVMANAIAKYGLEGFDALLELIGDPSIAGYHRTYFIDGAKRAAGDDPVLRARIAEVLRQVFTRVVGEVRESQALEQELLDSEDEEEGDDEDNVDLHGEFIEEIDEDDPEMVDDEELENLSGEAVEDPGAEEARQPGESDDLEAIHRMDADNEIYPDDALSLLASDLSDLADPLARDMIQSAFDEGLIDDCISDPDSVMSIYERGGEAYEQKAPWLQEYSASYFEEIRIREGLARMPQVQFPSRTSYPSFAPAKEAPPAPVQPVEPFRYAAPKIGRNDPCWCGSGKKYKRCHLGKDAP